MPALSKAKLCGVWTLRRFELTEGEAPTHPWGFETHGSLIYTASGHMSVAINRFAPWNKSGKKPKIAPKDSAKQILFYAGTFTLKGDVVRHQVLNASSPDRIGVEQVRKAKLIGKRLTLTARGEDYTAELEWEKIS